MEILVVDLEIPSHTAYMDSSMLGQYMFGRCVPRYTVLIPDGELLQVKLDRLAIGDIQGTIDAAVNKLEDIQSDMPY